MNDVISQLDAQIADLKKLQKQLLASEQAKANLLASNKITDIALFGAQLNEKRKRLKIDLQTLALQTELSQSTLKRLFKDPSQVKFATVLLVANTLGVSICTA